MSSRREERKRQRHERRRRRRGCNDVREPARRSSEAEEIDAALLTPEERALREARRAADAKADFAGDTIKFAVVGLLLVTFLRWFGFVILLCWGAPYLKRAYRRMVEPRLRERFLEEEVSKQVRAHIADERRALVGEHARSMHDLSASIAHEIRNPITAAKSLVQQMEEEPSAAENVEYARVALEELSRVERSVSHLLRFARDEEMRVAPLRLSDVVDSALETFRDRVARSGIEIRRKIDSEGPMRGDAEKLRRVVINLVGNAIDALSESGTDSPRIDVQMGENLAGTEVWLRIADNGPGIDREALEKMWSPFYTSKESGTGLGLSICRKLVDAHGGSIEVNPDAVPGAAFVLSFPRHAGFDGEAS